ncbi:hypothetical protein AIIKEEIJ_03454 [Rhodococcus sp. YH1]|nr:hypothetical protein [Rhodococcus sp. YH1]
MAGRGDANIATTPARSAVLLSAWIVSLIGGTAGVDTVFAFVGSL